MMRTSMAHSFLLFSVPVATRCKLWQSPGTWRQQIRVSAIQREGPLIHSDGAARASPIRIYVEGSSAWEGPPRGNANGCQPWSTGGGRLRGSWEANYPCPPPPPPGASGQRLVGGVVGVQNRGVAPPVPWGPLRSAQASPWGLAPSSARSAHARRTPHKGIAPPAGAAPSSKRHSACGAAQNHGAWAEEDASGNMMRAMDCVLVYFVMRSWGHGCHRCTIWVPATDPHMPHSCAPGAPSLVRERGCRAVHEHRAICLIFPLLTGPFVLARVIEECTIIWDGGDPKDQPTIGCIFPGRLMSPKAPSSILPLLCGAERKLGRISAKGC